MNTNPIDTYQARDEKITRDVHFDNPELQTIIRIRLLSDYGTPFWDVSYVHGRTRSGEKVRVIMPAHWFQIPKAEGPVKWILRTTPQIRRLCYVKDVLSLCQ